MILITTRVDFYLYRSELCWYEFVQATILTDWRPSSRIIIIITIIDINIIIIIIIINIMNIIIDIIIIIIDIINTIIIIIINNHIAIIVIIDIIWYRGY